MDQKRKKGRDGNGREEERRTKRRDNKR